MKTDKASLKDISFGDIQKYIDKDAYQNFFKQISPSIFKMALNDKDWSKVIASIMKVLKERYPQNATEEYANKVADRMQELAKVILEGE